MMLSRAVRRTFQTPARRATPAAVRIASSTTWIRTMAHNNRRTQPNQNQKKPETSKPSVQNLQTKPGSAFTAAAPIAQNLGAKSGQSGKPEFSTKQDEFETGASSSENTAPQATSPSAIDPAEAQPRSQPLPDLTQGIPSTIEYETAGATSKISLNLTEVEEPGQSSGGKSKGQLPDSAYVSSSERNRLRLANYMYLAFAGASVAGIIYLARNWESDEEETKHPEAPSGWELGLMWNRAKARLGDQLNYYQEPAFQKLLPDPDPMFERPYTLVMGMEDLLIHSEWTREHGWRIAKRPGVDYFIRYLSQYYELVIFTNQPSAIADPIIRKLDPFRIITWPLFREATLYEDGEYIKDLSYLNRDMSKVIIIDTKAAHVKKQPENAIVLKPWEGQSDDTELVGLIPFLEYIHTMAYSDVRKAISSFKGQHIPSEFARREAIARKKFYAQIAEEQKKKPKHSGVGLLGNALGIKHQSMMVDPLDQSPAEAFAQGKMLQDQARERGQRNYKALDKEIRENGEKWLRDEAALEEKAKEETTKAMKSGFASWFGGGK